MKPTRPRPAFKITRHHRKGCVYFNGLNPGPWTINLSDSFYTLQLGVVLVAMCKDSDCDAEAEINARRMLEALNLPRGHVRRKG